MGSDLDAALDATATATGAPPSTTTPGGELASGIRLGHFQISKKLGAGAMGEVYLATDLALDRPVAVKVLATGTTTQEARERMIREARAQARVMHSNVAHIYFIGEDAGRLYFAMELVSGETLAERCAKGPIAAEQALALIHDAVLGLREAQRAGFTHRDVKPSNLMVDAHGVIKVLDFGLAAGAPEHAGDGGPVAQTTLAGTPLYMAPEQARGEPVDFRADVYALGATLYQLVSGRPPFQAQSAAELRSLHETAVRPSIPRGVVPRIQGTALDGLISRMMAPRPADRFASYDELLRAIELVSTQYTRPAGFWVRMIAGGIDQLSVLIVLGLTMAVLWGGGDVPMGLIGIPLVALVETLLVVRWGTTLGGALFELQIADVTTGIRPPWRSVLARELIKFGPFIAAEILARALAPLHIPVIKTIFSILWAIIGITWIVHVLYASLRVPGKRTAWDRRSGTIVRYRR
ncbi:MAG: protein kinase [Deltaproteobacteria bacterium]|nr:protein kinase [Deltaproteobacteria bacterium]